MVEVLVAATRVGTSFDDVDYSFVYDEVYRLALSGVRVHVAWGRRGNRVVEGIRYHGLDSIGSWRALVMLLRVMALAPSSLPRNPVMMAFEARYSGLISWVAENYGVDLIHAHFAYPEGFSALLAKHSSGLPLVVTLHGYDLLVEPTVGYGIRLYRRYDVLVRKVLNGADAVIVPSSVMAREAARAGVDRDRLYLIPNGVDTTIFNPGVDGSGVREELGLDDEFIVFTPKNHMPQYGLEYLIKAAAVVLGKRDDVAFIIAGRGPLTGVLKDMAKRLGIYSNTYFVGLIPRSRMPEYYAASDVVVVPSLQESFGLVVTEAMATGKPVIASRVGGIPDQVEHGYNGFLVEPRDYRGIAARILELASNRELAAEMGRNGRRIAVERFDIRRRIDAILRLYRMLA